jgi:chemotaxis protein MotB
MQAFKTTILVASVAALAGCASWQKDSSVASSSYDTSPICPTTHGWQAWSDVRCNPPEAPKVMATDTAAELAAARQRNADLERQLADSEAREADLRSQLDQRKGHLAKAEKDLLKALQPEISKGTVLVHQSGETLTINLASGLLFGSGQDHLKAGGTDALKRVGSVLKDFPEKQVHVAGYTDDVAITGALQKKFPSNKELSDARANSAAQALRDGGVSSNLSAAGHGDSNPIVNNNTAAGRAKNRRVEVRVT